MFQGMSGHNRLKLTFKCFFCGWTIMKNPISVKYHHDHKCISLYPDMRWVKKELIKRG